VSGRGKSSDKSSSKGAHGRIRSNNHYAIYYMFRYPRNKLRRILRSNGYSAACSWADKHEASGILLALVKSGAKTRGELK